MKKEKVKMSVFGTEKKEMTPEELELMKLDEEIEAEKSKVKLLQEEIKPSALETKKEELARQKLEAKNLEVLKEAKANNKRMGIDIDRVDCPDGRMILVKKLPHAVNAQLQDMGDKLSGDALISFAQKVTVYPTTDQEKLDLFKEFSPLAAEAVLVSGKMAGLKAEVRQKK